MEAPALLDRLDNDPWECPFWQAPIHYSNVQLLDPVNSCPVRCQWRYLEDGTKVRVTTGQKASGSIVPRPDILTKRKTPILSTGRLPELKQLKFRTNATLDLLLATIKYHQVKQGSSRVSCNHTHECVSFA